MHNARTIHGIGILSDVLSSQCQNMSEATLHKNITCAIQAHRYTFAGKLAVSNRSGSLICKCKNDKP